jgi:uncharacterized protein
VPAAALGELAHVIESRLGPASLDGLLADLQSGVLHLDRGEEDVPRIRELIRSYENLPLGYVDAAVVACAERSGGKVLTLDPDFRAVAQEGKIFVLPA